MPVQRYLASAWATVHGPSDPRRLLVAVLDHGFAGLGLSPGPRPVDWGALRRAALDLPVDFAAVRVGNPLAERSAVTGLCSAKEGERAAALAQVARAVETARTLGCQRVVLDPGDVPISGAIDGEDLGDPNLRWTADQVQALLARRKVGRNSAVERACRELFGLARAYPDVRFCLTQGRSLRSVADLDGLRDIFADLPALRLGYWHDAAICARQEQVLGQAQGEWLESFSNKLSGMSLGDGSADGLYLAPGSGGVDYRLLATYTPIAAKPTPAVVELDPAVAPSDLGGIRSCLDKHGL